jgi:hypothetical protein
MSAGDILMSDFGCFREAAWPNIVEPIPKPTFLPLMKRPCAPVEKAHADYMRALLERTCAELRLPNG